MLCTETLSSGQTRRSSNPRGREGGGLLTDISSAQSCGNIQNHLLHHRFSKLNKQKINPYTYLPFGIGPRNCLGMRFAQVLVKVALVEALLKYNFQVCEETEVIFGSDTMNSFYG